MFVKVVGVQAAVLLREVPRTDPPTLLTPHSARSDGSAARNGAPQSLFLSQGSEV